ncbi:MAG: AmmeMemoRadiSam system protein B [Desulfobacca sp. 4484_104]|nr:MAG: AmmeMemoRadiSam system protein B [Desulfobacca sp. 4484_104]RLA91108.1 MAG: AmmeMemoRadiSam system protein B [Deltaproteobacteria bacterium]
MGVRQRTLPVGWYPGSAYACQEEIADFIRGVKRLPAGTKVYGGIMPHAGWYFSGKLAAQVFYLAAQALQPQVVCVFGGHLGSASPPLMVSDDGWETPLGTIPVVTEMLGPLRERLRFEEEYPGDNTIEIQLPFVKHFFPQAKLLALRAPQSPQALELGRAVVEVAQNLNLSLLAFGSADLTHYGPNYGWAPKGYGAAAVKWVKEINDKHFIDQALALNAKGVLEAAARDQSSCSPGAVAAAISAAKALGASQARLVDYYTSYDIRPGDSFVGYAGIVLTG